MRHKWEKGQRCLKCGLERRVAQRPRKPDPQQRFPQPEPAPLVAVVEYRYAGAEAWWEGAMPACVGAPEVGW